MRVRTSADSIRNLERLLAFDEAAGSKGIWSASRPDVETDTSATVTTSNRGRSKAPRQAQPAGTHTSPPAHAAPAR